MTESVLEMKDLTFSYKNGKIILDHLNFSFEKGKCYAILGQSGSGKTTLLSLLGGMEKIPDGQILYKGEDIWKGGARKYRNQHVGMIFQDYNLLEYMNGVQNITAAMEITDNTIENPEEYCLELLEKVGIDKSTSERNVKKISGGEQQRIAVARALAKGADIILADEPTGNLDEDTAAEIMKLFLKIAHEEQKCVIMVTHSKSLAQICDIKLHLVNAQIEKE